jgi:ribosomal protein S18 acetylase RimI-like enzyme
MTRAFLLQHTEPNEFYVELVDGTPVSSVILQDSERNQSWKPIDGDISQRALYVHWLCVARAFSGQGYSKIMVDFAADEARKRGFKLLRLDTDAEEKKLCKLYESLGFKLMGTEQEENHKTAFYQKVLR